jgi:hypothetical protein
VLTQVPVARAAAPEVVQERLLAIRQESASRILGEDIAAENAPQAPAFLRVEEAKECLPVGDLLAIGSGPQQRCLAGSQPQLLKLRGHLQVVYVDDLQPRGIEVPQGQLGVRGCSVPFRHCRPPFRLVSLLCTVLGVKELIAVASSETKV